MSQFHFRLETLMRLRKADRDDRRADLAKALRAEELLQSQKQSLSAEQASVDEAARTSSSPGAADVDALVRMHRYRLVLRSQQQQLAAQIAQVADEVDRRRSALVEADRQVRVLEKLREKLLVRHQSSEGRRELKAFDELASFGHVRRQETNR
jgi:flagellar protein FliJ